MQVDARADSKEDMSVYQGDFFVLWPPNRGNTMGEPAP
jgi:hypothetical protein